ncbi:hypothetical protein AAC03nite_04900 [Alicyclobacillus acidoterrestris]|nr:hypothetical protein AAC03nite_04900 [Alicyclobacillus acidoterrestris]
MKRLRLSKGLTQDALSTRAFIDRGFYAQIENGTRDPSIHVATNIANALGISPQIFFVEQFMSDRTDYKDTNYNVYAHCDRELRYTWIWHPFSNFDNSIGKRDDEVLDGPGISELQSLKQRVITDGVALEKVILFDQDNRLAPYLVRAEPLLNDTGEVVGVSTILTWMPALLTAHQNIPPQEMREILRGHIFYSYESLHAYIDYCSTYVLDGVKYGYRVCLITSDATYMKVRERVQSQLTKEQLALIHFVPSELVYQIDDSTNDEVMMQRHLEFLSPIFQLGVPVRTWSEVTSSERKSNEVEILINWEAKVQQEIGKRWLTSVCAYEGSRLSGSTMTALMRSHEYFLTDKEIVCSPLYRNDESRCYV